MSEPIDLLGADGKPLQFQDAGFGNALSNFMGSSNEHAARLQLLHDAYFRGIVPPDSDSYKRYAEDVAKLRNQYPNAPYSILEDPLNASSHIDVERSISPAYPDEKLLNLDLPAIAPGGPENLPDVPRFEVPDLFGGIGNYSAFGPVIVGYGNPFAAIDYSGLNPSGFEQIKAAAVADAKFNVPNMQSGIGSVGGFVPIRTMVAEDVSFNVPALNAGVGGAEGFQAISGQAGPALIEDVKASVKIVNSPPAKESSFFPLLLIAGLFYLFSEL